MQLSDIASALNLPCPIDLELTGVSIDTRKLQAGELFIAIEGERFDGHDYIQAAIAAGAAAIVCQHSQPDILVPQLVVPNTQQALLDMALHHRQRMNCQVIALTGSNGKTTVKEMIAGILPKPSHATVGNFNNHIGAPLSVLKLDSTHRYAVFELGANGPNDIAETVAIVKPHVALVNNIAPAHVAGFGSLDGVAHAKGAIYQGLDSDGTAIINADDDYAHFWDSVLAHRPVLRYSLESSSDVYPKRLTWDSEHKAQFVLVTPEGEAPVHLKVSGEHQVRNALAAAACSLALNIPLSDVVTGLESFKGVAGRLTSLLGKNKATIIDDTYNANLKSVLTAIRVLSQRPGKRILVFGDMGELGLWAQAHHEEVGITARKEGIDQIFTCGVLSAFSSSVFGENAQHYTSHEALLKDLLPELNDTTTVLVKGSRSAKMEKIVQQLVNE